METYILKKSNRKGKRFVIIMDKMNHHFGSDVGKTFVDNRTEKEKLAWEARHRQDKNWNNKHSSIFFSRHLLWGKHKDLKKNIKLLEKLLNVKIKVEI
tara:strand:+ start:138 stop:431 length:294 start_codon:yes stop_codon:yes gene_type:complete